MALRPIWRTPLPRLADEQDRLAQGQVRVAESADGLLAYHVAVENGVVYICQPNLIRALRLSDGQPVWPLPATKEAQSGAIFERAGPSPDVIPSRSAHAGVSRYCVTLDQGRLFARMGTAWTGGGTDFPLRDDQRSCLVGIDLDTQKLLFNRILPEQPGWEFESAPLAHGSQLLRVCGDAIRPVPRSRSWVMPWPPVARSGNARSDAATRSATYCLSCPTARCRTPTTTLYYNTNLGAVVALRAGDGRVRWMCRYRRSGLSDDQSDGSSRHFFRDLTPCLVDRGTVYVAATDCERMFALDAGFGQVLWNTSAGLAADAVHLLGVAGDKLLAVGRLLVLGGCGFGCRGGAVSGSSRCCSRPRPSAAAWFWPRCAGGTRRLLADARTDLCVRSRIGPAGASTH